MGLEGAQVDGVARRDLRKLAGIHSVPDLVGDVFAPWIQPDSHVIPPVWLAGFAQRGPAGDLVAFVKAETGAARLGLREDGEVIAIPEPGAVRLPLRAPKVEPARHIEQLRGPGPGAEGIERQFVPGLVTADGLRGEGAHELREPIDHAVRKPEVPHQPVDPAPDLRVAQLRPLAAGVVGGEIEVAAIWAVVRGLEPGGQEKRARAGSRARGANGQVGAAPRAGSRRSFLGRFLAHVQTRTGDRSKRT